MQIQPSQSIGDYEVLSTLGSGGMGTVYKVRSSITHRIEAMKVLLPNLDTQSELVERFLREIRISAGLDHPNIAALRSAQRDANRLLMVMEFVEGVTLSELTQRDRLPLANKLDYISQSLAALEYAHARGIIHRDIKPSNIMVTPSGQVKLMDFGVAKLTSDSKLTKTGFLVGSLHYMSPEQIEGKELDARSDLYSLGVTFYEMVTGVRPFNGDSEYQIMAAHLAGGARPPMELSQDLPPNMSDLILTALSRDPATRFGSAKAMKAAVDGVRNVNGLGNSGAQAVTQPITKPASLSPAGKSHRTAYMMAGSLATVAVLVLAAVEVPNSFHTKAHTTAPAIVQTSNTPPTATATPARMPGPSEPSAAGEDVPTSLRKTIPARKIPAEREPLPQIGKEQPAPENPAKDVTLADPAPANDQKMEALRDRMSQMDARIAAVRSSLDNLQSQQAASGLSLRTDMVAAQQHLLYLMNEADTNIRNLDAVGARKHLDAADVELSKLEGFLGR